MCSRMRSSASLSSGVSAPPKSDASNTWRISISPSAPVGLGQRLTHSIASSFDFTCHSQKPAISSLVSANGPSTTVRLSPENLTRAPFRSAALDPFDRLFLRLHLPQPEARDQLLGLGERPVDDGPLVPGELDPRALPICSA